VNRTALLKRIEVLERQIHFLPTLTEGILETATLDELDLLETEIEQGTSAVWDALVASYRSGESGS
jgi:hypothetical protein